jgi:hypothetical protein
MALSNTALFVTFLYFLVFSVMLQWFTDTMAAGYGAEVGDDVKMFMKWMGLEQGFIAMFSKMGTRQSGNTQALICLANAITLGLFLGDTLVNGKEFFVDGGMPLDGMYFNIATQGLLLVLNFAGWATGGAPMPTFGLTSGQPMVCSVNTMLHLVFGALMIFKSDVLMEQYFTFENGERAKPVLENSNHFINYMFKWLGMMFIGKVLRTEFVAGSSDTAAQYSSIRVSAFMWALQLGQLAITPFANKSIGWPFTQQTQISNFVMWFGMFYWFANTLVEMPYPENAKAKTN